MSQGLLAVPIVGTVSGLTMAGNINVGLAALASFSGGATAPTIANTGLAATSNLFWVDTGNSVMKKRTNADDAWTTFAELDFKKVLIADGNAAAPSYSFNADTDCGIYRIGTNEIGVAVNGSKVLNIAANGMTVTGNLAATGTVTVSGVIPGVSPLLAYQFFGAL